MQGQLQTLLMWLPQQTLVSCLLPVCKVRPAVGRVSIARPPSTKGLLSVAWFSSPAFLLNSRGAAHACWHAGQDSCGLAHVRLCQVCQGSGIQTEIYEYRRLEVRASHCSCRVPNPGLTQGRPFAGRIAVAGLLCILCLSGVPTCWNNKMSELPN